ncbi:phage tail terminator family protein [Clostridium cagae]|uniref:phage tail terminator family protein n=1 Tax=Clostridium cagae TaxID=2080751 RepID=UPI003F775D4A
MITLLEINKGINEAIEAALNETEFCNVTIRAEDLKEDIVRPSIKVMMDDGTSGKFNSCCKERTLTVRVYFYAKNKDKPKIENIKMREIIENAFLEDLKVSDTFYIPIDNVESVVTDGVLICTIDLEILEIIPESEKYEPMDQLDIEI